MTTSLQCTQWDSAVLVEESAELELEAADLATSGTVLVDEWQPICPFQPRLPLASA